MRVSLRITVLSGLYFTCLTLFPHIVFGQDGDNDDDRDRGRRESREDNGDDDGPRRGRGDFGDGRFGGPGGGGPWGGDGPRGGGPWGGRGGREGDGGPWGGGRDSWEGGGGRGPWGGRGGEEGGRRSRGGFGGGFGGFNPADLFARQDRNGDGQVSMDELDERSRGFMQRMAQNNGLSETGPWNIEEMRRSFEGRGGGDDRGDRGGRDRGDRDRDGGDRSESGDQPAANKSSVPGFGLASLEGAAGRLVPGFGIAASSGSEIDGDSNRTFGALARTNGRTSDGGGSRGGGSSSSSSSSAKPAASKAEADAQRMIKGNDANNDGKLQPDEMEGMFYKPKDPNNDGAVTLEELTAQLAKISGKSGDAKEEKSAAGGHSRGAGGDSSKKSMRFLTAKERLPDDIPDWFVDADEDEDGQVMMAEYAERWTESVAKKFMGLDTDGDGVITPAEATSGRKSRDR